MIPKPLAWLLQRSNIHIYSLCIEPQKRGALPQTPEVRPLSVLYPCMPTCLHIQLYCGCFSLPPVCLTQAVFFFLLYINDRISYLVFSASSSILSSIHGSAAGRILQHQVWCDNVPGFSVLSARVGIKWITEISFLCASMSRIPFLQPHYWLSLFPDLRTTWIFMLQEEH